MKVRCTSRFKLLLLSVCILATRPVHSQAGKPDDLSSKLNARVSSFQASGTFVDILGQAAHTFSVPMGIAWIPSQGTEEKKSVDYPTSTVLQVIQAIAASEPGYEVTVTNGVVHVLTTEIPANQNFLRIIVPELSGKNVASVLKAGLWMLLNREIAPNPPKGYGASIYHGSSDPIVDLNFTNTEVATILDAIAAGSNEKVWVVTFTAEPKLLPSGFRRTQSLLSSAPVPDDQQPAWDIFSWDHWPIPSS